MKPARRQHAKTPLSLLAHPNESKQLTSNCTRAARMATTDPAFSNLQWPPPERRGEQIAEGRRVLRHENRLAGPNVLRACHADGERGRRHASFLHAARLELTRAS